jgi:hypothetical protein
MRTIFIDSGLDDHLAEKIEKGQVYNNVPEHLPKREVKVRTLYKALEQGQSLLTGCDMPSQEKEVELRKALDVVSRALEEEEKKRQDAFVTEEELLEALDYLTQTAKELK